MHPRFSVILAIFVGLAVTGCAGTNVTPGPSLANPASQAAATSFGLVQTTHRGAPALRVNPDASYKRALYVADGNSIKILSNTYYHELGTITNGIAAPDSDSMDQRGNLYVANFNGGDVTEYAPGDASPSFTYNARMSQPWSVAVDRQGNIYEGDVNGNINQYFQGYNSVSAGCQFSTLSENFPSGLAVDTAGDVFMAVTGVGILEYVGGLRGCNATLLYSDGDVHGLALDTNNNLICAGGFSGSVFVLAPPYYSTVSRTIGSGFSYAIQVSLSKNNKRAFVVDGSNRNVTVVNYQTGANIKVLGSPYGITSPLAAVDGPNAVY